MEKIRTKQSGFGWLLVGAVVAPFSVISAYLFFTRWLSYRSTPSSDYAGLTVSVLAGAVFVAILPIRPIKRVLSLLPYVPLLAMVLFFYAFWFIAVIFDDAL
jgi:hypothetical protein